MNADPQRQEVEGMDAVLATLPPAGDRCAVTVRLAGDAFVLVEYGPIAFDLRLNQYAHAAAQAVEAAGIRGVTELAPGIRSLLVGFDPAVTAPDRVAEALVEVHRDVTDVAARMPRRDVSLPLAFADSTAREAVVRHRSTLEPGADVPADDVEAICRASGLAGPEEALAAVVEQRWFVAFIGYFPGLPFLLPMHATPELQVPKLDRPRAWTAEGAVSLGGKCVAIFPVEAPGSYRVFGRTVPIYNHLPVNDSFAGDQMLLRPGDVVRFEAVSEDDLADLRRDAFENRYAYRIEDGAATAGASGGGAR